MRNILILSTILVLLYSCQSGRYAIKPIENGKYSRPTYKANGGEKPTTIFNKRKVDNEARNMALYAALTNTLGPGPTFTTGTIVDTEIEKVRVGIQKEIDELFNKLNAIDPLRNKDHEKYLEITTQLNDLIYKKIKPYQAFKKKTIIKIESGISFNTGKSTLKTAGYDELISIIRNIELDILKWKEYVDDHNQKIFENDNYKLTVHIAGYADKQGNSADNLNLSKERAFSIKAAFFEELKKLSLKYNIDPHIDDEGKGEELPPGVIDNGKDNDERRRICLISSVIGPISLLK